MDDSLNTTFPAKHLGDSHQQSHRVRRFWRKLDTCLPFISEGVHCHLARHALVVEDAHFPLIVHFDQLLASSRWIRDIQLQHKCFVNKCLVNAVFHTVKLLCSFIFTGGQPPSYLMTKHADRAKTECTNTNTRLSKSVVIVMFWGTYQH